MFGSDDTSEAIISCDGVDMMGTEQRECPHGFPAQRYEHCDTVDYVAPDCPFGCDCPHSDPHEALSCDGGRIVGEG